MDWLLTGGTVLRDGAMVEDALALTDGRVAEAPDARAMRFDASGLLVLPGLVDIHGDAHERQLQPRPGVDLPAGLALRDSAAQLLACGITTAYLGVTLSWEPGLRSRAAWRALKAALPEARARSATDLRVHLRFEADNLDALEDALDGIADGSVHLLGFNDHTPAIVKKLHDPVQVAKYAGRAGMKAGDFRGLAESVMARREEIPAARERLAAAARAAGIPLLSHDDATLDDRAHYRAYGATICEFPMAEEVAADARAAGEHVVMGAPNVVRGGSHLGWASAAPLAERGLVTVLASDYVWPAMLEAAFAMVRRGVMDLPRAWALVSANPAEACGLADRGRLAPGLRGDVVLVDPATQAPVAVFAAGGLAWLAPGAVLRLRR
ncbi:alpha-D-ribose 1-methylphosphonate 5-triphosphate diphosphatase [Roseomonas eburnea]|uniref:Alpha-D-ribose 1-methylphosphonate 5-triphosphate diphosphatase n=1 Tax=Neoroseomonas eburnea TaxID=1346889 RepID=A0A9X9XD67_9PROT|nr:alpha-D-ribose 1-methylphosphonate 5-triphosphate diphosphatase [Neoroseomonas eburnea]MBR0681653.1 alpha-D-ribose 1-methylphosphonate 5-triphosphate diphosphatase [Neoroseomonas eburnea]